MVSTSQNAPAIEVRNLVKRYAKAAITAIDDISFTVQPGEIFGLLGPNGAGKTTAIGILTTSIIPTGGTAHIMGIDVARNPFGVKQRISVVPQRSNLDQHLKVREILTFHASYHGIPRVERNARADVLLAEFGLTKRSKELVSNYSGGMAQRVMIARALMHTPDVLFLDEPTNNLDPQTRFFLWERIRALQKQGITILLTTHDMEEASRLCDRIAIMDHGHILVCDTPGGLEALIPGGTTLELRVNVPERTLVAAGQSDAQASPLSAAPQLHQAFGSLPGVTRVEEIHDPKEAEDQARISVFRLYAEDASALIPQAINLIAEWNAELRDLHLTRPSLADVFIYLTGRNLRS
ncbi:MAG TPA: ATP-binding cassette domain-containing protein [Ktedonobacteraceae bacterium]|jgi:ABC-2 type transport system ATP-binding protein|nr:ATP-binding cassette domain-containing protein [Ktedonobacteraceae bacterium]